MTNGLSELIGFIFGKPSTTSFLRNTGAIEAGDVVILPAVRLH